MHFLLRLHWVATIGSVKIWSEAIKTVDNWSQHGGDVWMKLLTMQDQLPKRRDKSGWSQQKVSNCHLIMLLNCAYEIVGNALVLRIEPLIAGPTAVVLWFGNYNLDKVQTGLSNHLFNPSTLPLHLGHWGSVLVHYPTVFTRCVELSWPFSSIVSQDVFWYTLPVGHFILQEFSCSVCTMIRYGFRLTPLWVMIYGHKNVFDSCFCHG
jgi:hypothetical protein